MSDEIKLETIEKTQKLLGKHISKPVLTEKLLRKPPFRFLHDIITAVIKDTGFLKGLYSETELISDNVKEREAKLLFLNKLIDAVKQITHTDLAVKSNKIIAGLEPSETNKLLQAIGKALDKKLDSTEYVKKARTKVKSNKESKNKKIKNDEDKVSEPRKKNVDVEKPNDDKKDKNKVTPRDHKTSKSSLKTRQEEKITSSSKMKETNKVISSTPKSTQEINAVEHVEGHLKEQFEKRIDTTQEEEVKVHEQPKIEFVNDVHENDKQIIDSEQKNINPVEAVKQNANEYHEEQQGVTVSKKANRPMSARPQSGQGNRNSLVKDTDAEKSKYNTIARPMSSLRPPSVRPTSARPGAPRLKSDSILPLQEPVAFGKINVIVENFNHAEAEDEETVVIETKDKDFEPQDVPKNLDLPADKGHLVEQILEQINGDISEHTSKTDIDWENESFRNKDTNKEISQLRAAIQSLTKVANPLGKVMNYLHEDVEAMHLEMNTWINMKRQMYIEIKKQTSINTESSAPLKIQLDELEENIKKQESEISNIRANILQNETRIRELLET